MTGSMPSRNRAAWRVAAASGLLALVLLGAWVLRSPFVGLADNGDWGRYSCPVGLSGEGRFDVLPATVAAGDCPAYDYRSTFVPFLAAAKAVEVPLFGSVHLQHLATFWAVVVAAGWAWFGFELTMASGRAARSFACTAALVVVSSDVAFSAYFGSLYGEAMIFGLLPAVAASLIRLCRTDRVEAGPVAIAGVLLVAVTAAKPSMAFTAALFVAVVAIARRDSLSARALRVPVLASLCLALFSLVAIADPNFTEWNTYNLAFTVVAPESGSPHGALLDMGLDDADAERLRPFVGVEFGPSVTEEWDGAGLTAFRAQGRTGVYRALATRPRVWWRMLDRGTSTLDDLHLSYLSNQVRSVGMPSGPALADRPHPANLVLAPISRLGAPLLGLWLLVLGWFARRAWIASRGDGQAQPGDSRSVNALVAFGAAMAVSQTVLALGDGYYELAKHLVVAGYASSLILAGLVVTGAWDLVARILARSATIPSAPGDADGDSCGQNPAAASLISTP